MALIDARAGRCHPALRWARNAHDELPRHRSMFFDRTPALVEILTSSRGDAARGRALLGAALGSVYGTFNRPVHVRLTGLASLDAVRRGEDALALELLRAAVERAHEGGMVRSLADLGRASSRCCTGWR